VQKNLYWPFFTVALTSETPPSVTTSPTRSEPSPGPSSAMLCGVPDGFGDRTVSGPASALAALVT
jgi:hypothetical protein